MSGDAAHSDTPGPATAPYLSVWPYRVMEQGSKLGVHAIGPGDTIPWLRRLMAEGTRFPLVKAVDGVGLLAQVKELSPDTVTLGRVTSPYEACWGIENPSTNLDRMAERLVRVILDKIAASPDLQGGGVVDYWEICNEPDPPGPEGYRRLALLMIKCMEQAEQRGLRLALFTLNAGTPEWDEMQALVGTGVFARARSAGHILALHEGVFGNDPIEKWWREQIPGSPVVPGAGALCFRYRYLYHLLRQRGEVVPLVVSEFYAGGGYGQDGISPAEVVRRMAWYDAGARQDYYFWAFCPFTVGPNEGWKHADYGFAYPALVNYMLSIKEQSNGLPLSEEPPVAHVRGAPREQYGRVYVLLPPDADRDWALAALRATWDEHRHTVGGSADDAGIGDLDSRTVIAVNPSHWPDDLEQFFQTYYPGIRYIPVEADSPEQLAASLQSIRL